MTGYDLRLRSYHVHGSSKHGIARCVYENNNIRLVVERKAKILYWTCIFSNKENSTDNDNLTIRTRKTDRLKKKTQKNPLKIIFIFSYFFFQGTSRIRTCHFGFLSAPIL